MNKIALATRLLKKAKAVLAAPSRTHSGVQTRAATYKCASEIAQALDEHLNTYGVAPDPKLVNSLHATLDRAAQVWCKAQLDQQE